MTADREEMINFRLLTVEAADCLDDTDTAWEPIQEAKYGWQYAGQEVLICTCGGKSPIIQVILLPNLWICSLASFIPLLY